MIRKLISGVLAFVLAVSLVACDKDSDKSESSSSQAEITTSEETTTTADVTVAAILTSVGTTEEITAEVTTAETTTSKVTATESTTTAKTESTTTAAVTTSTAQATTAAVKGNKFTSTLGYTLIMPEGWAEAEWPAGLEGCTDENGNNFTALSSPYGKSFENMNKSYFTDYFKNFPKMEFKEYQRIEISGYTGHRVDVKNNYSATKVILQTQIYVIVNKKVLLFTFTDAEGSNQQKIEDMISSISFN